MALFYSLLKFLGPNLKSNLRVAHYVVSDLKIRNYRFQNREQLLPEHDQIETVLITTSHRGHSCL